MTTSDTGRAAPADFDPIEHVIVLMLENRSYDHLVGGLSETVPDANGVDPRAPRTNRDPEGRVYFQRPASLNRIEPDPKHEHESVMHQIANNNSGFVSNYAEDYPESTVGQRTQVMAYFPRGALRPMHALCERFALFDAWFCSVPGPTWTNRFFVHSGTSIGRVKMPEGILKPNLHLYNQITLYDRLNERGISWRIYYHDIPHSLILTRQLRPRNLRRYRSMQHFEDDVSSVWFPRYVFIEPAYMRDPNDDHPPHDSQAAQRLIARIYAALRRNSSLWYRSLLVITYDEHGGFYDHVPPGPTVPPDDHREEYTFDQLGLRVPTVFVSPWLGHQVVHTICDHTSLLKYLTDKWALGALGRRTAQAANPWLSLTKLSTPRGDAPLSISAPLPPPRRVSQARRLNEAQASLLSFSGYLERQLPSGARRHANRLNATPEEAGGISNDRLEAFFQERLGTRDPPG